MARGRGLLAILFTAAALTAQATPAPTPLPTLRPTPTPTPKPTPTPTPKPTTTPTLIPTLVPTSPTPTPTLIPTHAPTPPTYCAVIFPSHASEGNCGSELAVNATCTPACDAGYTLQGLIECQEGAPPLLLGGAHCRPNPCTPPSGVTSQALPPACEQGISISHGADCSPSCIGGFEPFPSTLTCRLGTFSPATYECKPKSCNAPVVQQAILPACYEGASVPHGSNCTTGCEGGGTYTPSVASLSCFLGTLSPTSYSCLAQGCNAPLAPTGLGALTSAEQQCEEGRFISHGGVCTARCAVGFTALPATLSCGLGTLTPNLFTCTPSKCQVADKLICKEGNLIGHGGTCTASCAAGFHPSVAMLNCVNGNLRPQNFRCLTSGCDAPPGIRDANSPACAEGPTIRHGGLCSTSCKPGFSSSVKILSCGLGALTPPSFSCVPNSCVAPASVDSVPATGPCVEGNALANGAICTTRCSEGFMASIASLRCVDGFLEPPSFSCSPGSCLAPSGIIHSADSPCVEGGVVGHGTVCTTKCATGFNAFPSYLSCGLGTLTPQSFTCSAASCAAPIGVANMATPPCVEGASINFGATCTSRCQNGYVPSVETLACISASSTLLSPATFDCLPAACAAPSGIVNAFQPACAEGDSISRGFKCTAMCQSGFTSSVQSLKCSEALSDTNGNESSLNPGAFSCTTVEDLHEDKVMFSRSEFVLMQIITFAVLCCCLGGGLFTGAVFGHRRARISYGQPACDVEAGTSLKDHSTLSRGLIDRGLSFFSRQRTNQRDAPIPISTSPSPTGDVLSSPQPANRNKEVEPNPTPHSGTSGEPSTFSMPSNKFAFPIDTNPFAHDLKGAASPTPEGLRQASESEAQTSAAAKEERRPSVVNKQQRPKRKAKKNFGVVAADVRPSQATQGTDEPIAGEEESQNPFATENDNAVVAETSTGKAAHVVEEPAASGAENSNHYGATKHGNDDGAYEYEAAGMTDQLPFAGSTNLNMTAETMTPIDVTCSPDVHTLLVLIESARNLQALGVDSRVVPYCTVERPEVSGGRKIYTGVKENTLDPEWNHEAKIEDYVIGQSLMFKVWDDFSDVIGSALLSGTEFATPDGYASFELPLTSVHGSISNDTSIAHLKVTVKVIQLE